MLIRPQPKNLLNDFFEFAWNILGETDLTAAANTWQAIAPYRMELEARLSQMLSKKGGSEDHYQAIRCEIHLMHLLEILHDITISREDETSKYHIYSKKAEWLSSQIDIYNKSLHRVISAYQHLILIFCRLITIGCRPTLIQTNDQTLFWESYVLLVTLNKFIFDFQERNLTDAEMQAMPNMNGHILESIYRCLNIMLTDKRPQGTEEKIGFTTAFIFLHTLADRHKKLLKTKSDAGSGYSESQEIKSKIARLEAIIIWFNLEEASLKPFRLRATEASQNNSFMPPVLSSVSKLSDAQKYYDAIRILTIRLTRCSHIFLGNHLTYGIFENVSVTEQIQRTIRYKDYHETMTTQLENVLCDAWMFHTQAIATLAEDNPAKNDIIAHLNRIVIYTEGILYQSGNKYYTSKVAGKIEDYTFAAMDFTAAQATYRLAPCAKKSRQLGLLYIKTSKQGLQCELLGLNESLIALKLPWDTLPKNFPRSDKTLLENPDNYISILLEHPLLIGNILPLDGLSCLTNSILRSKSERLLNKIQDENERSQYFKDTRATIETFKKMLEEKKQHLSKNQLLIFKQFIADYYFSHLLLCTRLCEASALTENGLCIEIERLLADTPNQALYSFVQTRHIIKLENIFRAELTEAEKTNVAELYKIEDVDFLELVQTQKIICTSSAPQIFNPVWLYFYHDITSMIERCLLSDDKKTKELAEKLQARMRDYSSALKNSLFNAIQQPVNKSSFIPPNAQSSRTKKSNTNHKSQPAAHTFAEPAKPTNHSQMLPLDTPFEAVCTFLRGNTKSIVEFYEKSFNLNKSRFSPELVKTNLHAFMGLANCYRKLALGKDAKVASHLKKILMNNENRLFELVAIHLIHEDINTLKKSYHDLMVTNETTTPQKSNRTAPATTKQKSVTKSTPSTPTQAHIDPVIQTSTTISTLRKAATTSSAPAKKPTPSSQGIFKDAKPAVAAKTTATEKLAQKKSSSVFADICFNHKLNIDLNKYDRAILDVLHNAKHSPLLHGGAVIDTLFNKKLRDIDMLCFASEATLFSLLNATHIPATKLLIHKNTNNVFSIYFMSDDPNLNKERTDIKNESIAYEYKQDIIFINPENYHSNIAALIDYAMRYGVNWTLYYDYYTGELIDPLRQFNIITKEKLIDVVFPKEILDNPVQLQEAFNQKCQSNPTLIAYIIEKSIRFEKEDVKISDRLSGLFRNLTMSTPAEGAPCLPTIFISLARIRKLFLTGQATKAYHRLHTNYNLLRYIFPELDRHNTSFLRACESVDARIKEKITDSSLTDPDHIWVEMEPAFLADALLDPFLLRYRIDNHFKNATSLTKEAILFLRQCKFYITNETRDKIIDRWKSEILKIERQQKLKLNAQTANFTPVFGK